MTALFRIGLPVLLVGLASLSPASEPSDRIDALLETS
jgi:hypothetical protein